MTTRFRLHRVRVIGGVNRGVENIPWRMRKRRGIGGGIVGGNMEDMSSRAKLCTGMFVNHDRSALRHPRYAPRPTGII